MSHVDPTPEHSEKASFFATTRKAFTAAGAAAVGSIGASIPAIFADGKIEAPELWAAAGVVLGAAAVAFAAVWRVPNDI